jgi:Na+/proline symporter
MTLVASVATISLFYFALLFGVAFYADQRCKSGKCIISNPYIYTLSLASVFSSWSFYGSVGRAATSGPDFLTFYLGISFVCFGFWFVLRKMVRIAKEQNIVSIADFIASRYGKSLSLGAIVTVLAVLAIAP